MAASKCPIKRPSTSLDPAERERFAPVESIARELAAAERDLKDATDRMGTLIEAHDAAEKVFGEELPKRRLSDSLWLQSTTDPTRWREQANKRFSCVREGDARKPPRFLR